MDTFHDAASFLGFSVPAPEKHRPDNGNYLEERETACCPDDYNTVGPQMFHFLFNCRFREASTIYASGLARAVRRIDQMLKEFLKVLTKIAGQVCIIFFQWI